MRSGNTFSKTALVHNTPISASTITVSTAEIRSEPAQPSRFEKKKNIDAPVRL